MARTIGLSDDAYDALAGLKEPGESFSDLVRRLVAEHRRRQSIRDSAGPWPMSAKEAERLLGDIYRARDQGAKGRPSP